MALQIDPMAAKFYQISPYALWANNPLKYIDPTGMMLWKPDVDENGSAVYTAEQGDNIDTFMSQYGVSREDAENIFEKNDINTKADNVEGESISGKSVEDVTGSEALKLKIHSEKATTPRAQQRVLDHLLFSLDHSRKYDYTMDPKQYFQNIITGVRGQGYIAVGDGEMVLINYDAALGYNNKPYNHPVGLVDSRNKGYEKATYYRSNGRNYPVIFLTVPKPTTKLWERISEGWQVKVACTMIFNQLFGEYNAGMGALAILVALDWLTKWWALSKSVGGFWIAWKTDVISSKGMRDGLAKIFFPSFSYLALSSKKSAFDI